MNYQIRITAIFSFLVLFSAKPIYSQQINLSWLTLPFSDSLIQDNSLIQGWEILSVFMGVTDVSNFNAEGTSFENVMTSGIMMSTGELTGMNWMPNASTFYNYPSQDTLLNQLDTSTVLYDINNTLNFGCTPLGDTLQWSFVFASEEFFTLTPKNDMLGVFVSGPKPGGGFYYMENVAFIPGTNEPITVFNLLAPANAGLINLTGDFLIPYDEPFPYNGYTDEIPFNFPVIPGESYAIGIRIGDGTNGNDDSAVFFKSGGLKAKNSNGSGSNVGVIAVYDSIECVDYMTHVVLMYAVTGYNPNGQIEITWSNGSHAIDSLLPAGTYSITASDINQFSDSTIYIFTIDNGTNPNVNLSASFDPIVCFGDSSWVDFTVTGGTSPFIGFNSSYYMAGSYEIIVEDLNQCKDTIYLEIAEPDELMIAPLYDSVLCHSDSTFLSFDILGGTPPYTSPIVDSYYSAGTYFFEVYDDSLCYDSISIEITEPDVFVLLPTHSTIHCNGDEASLLFTATGGTSPYDLPQDSVCYAGTFQYTASDENGCVDTATIVVEEPPIIVVNSVITPATSQTSTDGSIDLTVSGGIPPYDFYWNTSASSEDLINVESASYWVQIEDSNACQIMDTFYIPFIAEIQNKTNHYLSLFPNPAQDEITISQIEPNSIIEIYNILGELMMSDKYEGADAKLNIENLSTGTYIIRVSNNRGAISLIFEVAR
jgi:hypothetical protein